MFDFIRIHKRLMIFVLVLLLVPSTVFLTAHGLMRAFDNTELAVKVGKEILTKHQFDFLFKENLHQIKQEIGKNFDDSEENIIEIRKFLLKKITNDLILTDQIKKRGFVVSDSLVSDTIKSLPVFASLNKPNGDFDVHQYRSILAKQGMKPKQFDDYVRLSIAKNYLINSVAHSSLASKAVSEHLARKIRAEYQLQKMQFPVEKFHPGNNVTLDVLQTFYSENKFLFQMPRRAEIDYICLDRNKLKIVEPGKKELHDYYLANISEYTVPESVRASHILIKVGNQASDQDKNKAKEMAQHLLKILRNDPSKFAFLAKRHSDDLASANEGGDLGYFYKGSMIPAFEKIAFSLKKNEISEVTESEFGYHIILVKDIRLSSTKSFEEVKNKVRAGLVKKIRTNSFLDAKRMSSESNQDKNNLLEKLSEKTGLKIYHTTLSNTHGIQSSFNKVEKDDVLKNRKFVSAIFSLENELNKSKTFSLTIDEDRIVVVRLIKYFSAYTPSYEEIRDEVKKTWIRQKSKELADQTSQFMLNELRKNCVSLVNLQNEKCLNNYSFDKPIYIQPQRSAMTLQEKRAILTVTDSDLKNGCAYVRAKNIDGGFVIFRILSISLDKHSKELASSFMEQQLKAATTQAELDFLLDALGKSSVVRYYN